MPTRAQDRAGRGPFGALLILLSLLLGSGNAAAASDPRQPLARPASSRGGAATALLPSGPRNPLDDEVPSGAGGGFVPPPVPAVVTRVLWTRPVAVAAAPARRDELPRPAFGPYRARAPPAS